MRRSERIQHNRGCDRPRRQTIEMVMQMIMEVTILTNVHASQNENGSTCPGVLLSVASSAMQLSRRALKRCCNHSRFGGWLSKLRSNNKDNNTASRREPFPLGARYRRSRGSVRQPNGRHRAATDSHLQLSPQVHVVSDGLPALTTPDPSDVACLNSCPNVCPNFASVCPNLCPKRCPNLCPKRGPQRATPTTPQMSESKIWGHTGAPKGTLGPDPLRLDFV